MKNFNLIKSVTIFLFLFVLLETPAQVKPFERLLFQDPAKELKDFYMFNLSAHELILFYSSGGNVVKRTSTDNGLTWSIEITITLDQGANIFSVHKTINGFYIVYGTNSLIFSNDNCETWSSRYTIMSSTTTTKPSVLTTQSGETYIAYRNNGLRFARLNADFTWTTPVIIGAASTLITITDLSLQSDNQGNLYCYFSERTTSNQKVIPYYYFSSNNGATWSSKTVFFTHSKSVHNHRVLRRASGELLSFYSYQKDYLLSEGLSNFDIVYRKSSDNGISWSEENEITKYIGSDLLFSLSENNGRIAIVFNSERGGSIIDKKTHFQYINQLYFGYIGENKDINTPPIILTRVLSPNTNDPKIPQSLTFRVFDDDSIKEVRIKYVDNKNKTRETQLFAQPLLHPSTGKPFQYSIVFSGMINPTDIESGFYLVDVIAKDTKDNFTVIKGNFVQLSPTPSVTATAIDINNIWMPIDKNGILADVAINGRDQGRYDGKVFLFSGGFFLSGYNGNNLWANAVASASRIQDYQPGSYDGKDPFDGGIFILKSTDLPFGDTWKKWAYAVLDGAPFYDGDNDGMYKPIDKNQNGIWEPNEDRPILLGDYTAWTVINDGTPSEFRKFNDVSPQGIDIQQTVFGWNVASPDPLADMLFIRYSIINKSKTVNKFRDVYFSFWADPDLGDYNDDLSGCDTLLNSAFVYNDSSDAVFGVNPPSFFTSMLQGPQAYIPGVTFVDHNLNGIYDPGTDIALDTAYQMNGQQLGKKALPGARNQNISSFNINRPMPWSDVATSYEVRNLMLGLDRIGHPINLCPPFGSQLIGGIDCRLINPLFFYSGDPINKIGWVQSVPSDIRWYLNTGPFDLDRNKPVEIMAAFIVRRGNDALHSITKTKELVPIAQTLWRNNFSKTNTNAPTNNGVSQSNALFENYPNPFNPLTTIRFQLEKAGKVSLIVYDILGRKVTTLLNEEKSAGLHSVVFDAGITRLASGIYFYELKSNEYRQIKKMMVVK